MQIFCFKNSTGLFKIVFGHGLSAPKISTKPNFCRSPLKAPTNAAMRVRCFSSLNPFTPRHKALALTSEEDDHVPQLLKPAAHLGFASNGAFRSSSTPPPSTTGKLSSSSSHSVISAAPTIEAPANRAPFWDVPEELNVCILVVGTLGDVQPFIAIGEILRDHGHRVRIGTHENYRKLVLEHNLEFAPLAGDPHELSEFMVKHKGLLKPLQMGGMVKDMPRMSKVQKEIVESCWPAAVSEDFRATAILANPVAWGHVHVAEKLQCPLHIMFPQPWVPTKAFPHPATGWSVSGDRTNLNKWSFKMMDTMTWMSMASDINRWRRETLKLPPISASEGSKGLIRARSIPFSFLGSAALVEPPSDWPEHADIVGGVSMPESPYTPSPSLSAFLAAGAPPVLITFGSMRIQRPLVLGKRILAAARRTGTRVVVQSGWSDLAAGLPEDPLLFHLGKAPHSWLIPRVGSVVHHGGAGTSYAVAKAGKPSLICPFFGDQPFWAHIVHRTGAAAAPIAIASLTEEKLAAAFEQLQSGALRAAAEAIQAKVLAEGDGAANAVMSFYRQLSAGAVVSGREETLARSSTV